MLTFVCNAIDDDTDFCFVGMSLDRVCFFICLSVLCCDRWREDNLLDVCTDVCTVEMFCWVWGY